MRVVGIKVLKNKLSEYVRLAAGGETILVTDRDHVVAELSQPQASRAPLVADTVLAELVRKGWLSPPLVKSNVPPPRLPVAPFKEIMQELQADREDR